jgi:hypothetical protein
LGGPAPRRVNASKAPEEEPTTLPRLDIADMGATVAALTFALVASAGGGEVWKLTDQEAKQFGANLAACLKTIPARRKGKALKAVQNALPWVSLVYTTYAITMPRLVATREAHVRINTAGGANAGSANEIPQDAGGAGMPSERPMPIPPANGAVDSRLASIFGPNVPHR